MNLIILVLHTFFGFGRPAGTLDGCLSGNPAEIASFVQKHTPLIRVKARQVLFGARGGYGRLVSLEDVDDIVQITFEVLFRDGARTLRDYDAERGMSLESYVGRIAQREAHNFMDRLRARKRGGGAGDVPLENTDGAPLPLASSIPGADERLEIRQEHSALEAALLARLSDKGRLFFQLIYVEELETEEIVKALGVNRDVIYTWRRRIQQTCEAVMQGRADEQGT